MDTVTNKTSQQHQEPHHHKPHQHQQQEQVSSEEVREETVSMTQGVELHSPHHQLQRSHQQPAAMPLSMSPISTNTSAIVAATHPSSCSCIPSLAPSGIHRHLCSDGEMASSSSPYATQQLFHRTFQSHPLAPSSIRLSSMSTSSSTISVNAANTSSPTLDKIDPQNDPNWVFNTLFQEHLRRKIRMQQQLRQQRQQQTQTAQQSGYGSRLEDPQFHHHSHDHNNHVEIACSATSVSLHLSEEDSAWLAKLDDMDVSAAAVAIATAVQARFNNPSSGKAQVGSCLHETSPGTAAGISGSSTMRSTITSTAPLISGLSFSSLLSKPVSFSSSFYVPQTADAYMNCSGACSTVSREAEASSSAPLSVASVDVIMTDSKHSHHDCQMEHHYRHHHPVLKSIRVFGDERDLLASRPSLMDTDGFEVDLTTLLSGSIDNLGLHGCLSPLFAHSMTTPSSSSMTSPPSSPTVSVVATTMTPATATAASSPQSIKMLSSPMMPCPVPQCPRSFTRTFSLNTHLRTDHHLDPQDLGSLSSTASTSLPPSSTALPLSSSTSISYTPQQQQSQQPKSFPCHLCTRIFARKHDLQRHIRVHTGSKPYLCMNCQKAFARTDALCRHYKVEEACRMMAAQLEADERLKKVQLNQQQNLELEVKEWQKVQRQRQQQ